MCGCNAYRVPFESLSGSSLLDNQQFRDMMVDKTVISNQDFRSGDLLSIFNWTWCVSEKKFKDAFSKVGLDLEKSDLPQLVEIAKTGQDTAGNIKDRDGNTIKFSVIQTFSGINLTNQEVANANCTVQFV